jgi:hypothetical protein
MKLSRHGGLIPAMVVGCLGLVFPSAPGAPVQAAGGTSVAGAALAERQCKALDIEHDFRTAYFEANIETLAAGKSVATKTVYQDPQGHPLAERNLDYSHFPYKPGYAFKDFRNGYEEGARVEAGRVVAYYRDSTRAPLKEKKLEVPEPCVVNGGFNPYLKANWKFLEGGKRLNFQMVIPARLDYYRFAAYIDSTRLPPKSETGGRNCKTVVVEPQSAILRMVLSPIVITYDVANLEMVRYEGIVNVADNKGRSLRVRVDYPPGRGP